MTGARKFYRAASLWSGERMEKTGGRKGLNRAAQAPDKLGRQG